MVDPNVQPKLSPLGDSKPAAAPSGAPDTLEEQVEAPVIGEPVDAAPARSGSQTPAPPARPPGEVGGHTVLPSEQPDVLRQDGATSRGTPAPQSPDEGPKTGDPTKVEAPTVRAEGASQGPTKPKAEGARTEPAPATGRDALPSFRMREPGTESMLDPKGQAALVEQITSSLAAMLARALHQSVEEAVQKAIGGPAKSIPKDQSVPKEVANQVAREAVQKVGQASGQAVAGTHR